MILNGERIVELIHKERVRVAAEWNKEVSDDQADHRRSDPRDPRSRDPRLDRSGRR